MVIADCRKISEEEAKKRKLVLAHEVLKVLGFLGLKLISIKFCILFYNYLI
jgi:hypothetical protein